jgi:hypothetical protein
METYSHLINDTVNPSVSVVLRRKLRLSPNIFFLPSSSLTKSFGTYVLANL